MTLPKILTEHATVTIAGQDFDIRSLTRAEAAKLQKMVADGKQGSDLEIEMIAAGTDTPRDEVRAWYEATPSKAVDQLVTAIRDLSRVDDDAQKSG